ncbi:MAG: PQQ-binding-like beta-propeller repeat protein [Candidatus Omnitrophota bacterium]
MSESVLGKIISASFALAGIAALCLWIASRPPMTFEERVPGQDKSGAASEGGRTGPEGVLLTSGEIPASLQPRPDGLPADLRGAWPCFRGKDLDNICKDNFKPTPKDSGFTELWSLDVGEGFAGAAVLNGRVYMLDYDREKKADALRCLSLAEGKEIWRYTYPENVKRNHGMSRTIPYVTEKYVVSIGPKCQVTCLNSKTGEKKWSLDLVNAYDAEVPPWYAGQCPLIDGDRVILAPGGSALMIAVDIETGETVWESPNPNDWKMTHSSITPMDFNGRRMYVYCASGGVAGVSAKDGSILWETPEWTIRMANVPSPLAIGDERLFLSGGYKAGSMMLKLEENSGRIVPSILFRLKPERFGSPQHTPILYNGFIYGIRPDGMLVCLDLDGNEKWNSTSAYKFGLGPYTIAGSLIYAMNDNGLLSRVEAAPDGFRLWDQTQVLQGSDSWAPIAVASGRLILRDLTRMVCLRAGTPE